MTGFHCSFCGKYHEGLPFSYSIPAPIYWTAKLSRDKNSELGQDICVIKSEHFFLRGNIEIPIIDADATFAYSVWVSLSKNSFEQISANWNNPERVYDEPYFGWLSCRIPGYPDTLNLKTLAHNREVGIAPFIQLEPTDHPLSVEQQSGITMKRVKEIAEQNLHSEERNTEENGVRFWKRFWRHS